MHFKGSLKIEDKKRTSSRKESYHGVNLHSCEQSWQNFLYFWCTSMGHLQQSAYYSFELTEPSCFAVHPRVVVNSLLILQHLGGDILSSSISIYHVHSPKPVPLLPSPMKECPIPHERATNREIYPVITLPILWSYFLRCSTCQLSVVSRGKTPLSDDKQATLTGTRQKNKGWRKSLLSRQVEKKSSCPQFCSLSRSGSEPTGLLRAGFSLKSWPLVNLMGSIRESKEGMFRKTPSNPTEVSPNGMNSCLGSQKEAQG